MPWSPKCILIIYISHKIKERQLSWKVQWEMTWFGWTLMCDHITWLAAFLCSLSTFENVVTFKELWIFRDWMLLNTEKLPFSWCGKRASKRFAHGFMCFKNGIKYMYHQIQIYTENEARAKLKSWKRYKQVQWKTSIIPEVTGTNFLIAQTIKH